MRKFFIFLSLLLGLAFASLTQEAKAQTSSQLEGVIFSQIEKRLIRNWIRETQSTKRYEDDDDAGASDKEDKKGKKGRGAKGKNKKAKGKPKMMPKGLAKRKKLPPGLAKRKSLPHGLAKRNLPPELEQSLPPPRPGTARIIVEDAAVLLVEEGTNIVLDIIEKSIRGKN
ncbi:MAG: hypothetical protein HOE62_15740 [Alphaproteobacteria bacterium]|nr:hypothetical protein [Alphaproteobacteria bacterium]MBT4019404.1 hypothetical protein [Alphaproteobacteria bacterium]MBT5160693.1 hypothetical protein [Alphaproteobacteria bacterium]